MNLSNWFENVFESGWQTVENLFGTAEARFAFTGKPGERFSIKVVLGEASITEDFVI